MGVQIVKYGKVLAMPCAKLARAKGKQPVHMPERYLRTGVTNIYRECW